MNGIQQTTIITTTREAVHAKPLALATSALALATSTSTTATTVTTATPTATTVQVPEENICNDYRKYYLFPITIILIGLFIGCIIVCS